MSCLGHCCLLCQLFLSYGNFHYLLVLLIMTLSCFFPNPPNLLKATWRKRRDYAEIKGCRYLLGVSSYKHNKLTSVRSGDNKDGGRREVQRSY